jgi:hypothetical protein
MRAFARATGAGSENPTPSAPNIRTRTPAGRPRRLVYRAAMATEASEAKMNDPSTTFPDPQQSDGGPSQDATQASWRGQADELSHRVREFVTQHPLPALGIAVAAGFLVGRIVRR